MCFKLVDQVCRLEQSRSLDELRKSIDFKTPGKKKCLEKVNDYLENQRNPQPLYSGLLLFQGAIDFPKSLLFNCGVPFFHLFFELKADKYHRSRQHVPETQRLSAIIYPP